MTAFDFCCSLKNRENAKRKLYECIQRITGKLPSLENGEEIKRIIDRDSRFSLKPFMKEEYILQQYSFGFPFVYALSNQKKRCAQSIFDAFPKEVIHCYYKENSGNELNQMIIKKLLNEVHTDVLKEVLSINGEFANIELDNGDFILNEICKKSSQNNDFMEYIPILIDNGAHIKTALNYIVKNECNLLIKKFTECKISQKNLVGIKCPLVYAIGLKNPEIVKFFLKNGVEWNIPYGRSYPTIIHCASCIEGMISPFEDIIKQNKDYLNSKEPGLMIYAFKSESYENALILYRNGICFDDESKKEMLESTDKKIKELKKFYICDVLVNGTIAKVWSLIQNHIEIKPYIISLKEDEKKSSVQNLWKLVLAKQIFQLIDLIQESANEFNDKPVVNGRTPFVYALEKCQDDALDLLYDHRIPVSLGYISKNEEKEFVCARLFKYAIEKGKTDLIDAFINEGKEFIDKPIIGGLTPIIYAFKKRNEIVIQKLINAGVSPNVSFDLTKIDLGKVGNITLKYIFGAIVPNHP